VRRFPSSYCIVYLRGETYTVYVNYDLPDGDTWEVALLFVDDAYENFVIKATETYYIDLAPVVGMLQLI